MTPEQKARVSVKMGTKAPQKVKPFLRHVGVLLGTGNTSERIDAMVAKLEAAGVAWFIGDEVVYGRKWWHWPFEVANCDFKFDSGLRSVYGG
jgi:hypothetical protein